MSKLTREDILKLARLARLDVTDDEVEEYSKELSAVLDYVERLNTVDIEGLEPTLQITGLENVTRDDVVQDYGYKVEDLRKNLPAEEKDHIKVNRMVG
jgi:aspartyl-tRNA(Asn)/glutamyl-tRNA(Gln) amidotransferase subunit C